jgi:small multidrug resistance family-3 protein
LIVYSVIPTFQPAHFGRVYAAYGGVFIVLSLLWGWGVDGNVPDRFDILGAMLSLLGVCILMYWPR